VHALTGRRRGSTKKATGRARGFIIGETPADCAALLKAAFAVPLPVTLTALLWSRSL
jgi:hypothetical protein